MTERNRGFTIVELLVVIAIIGALVGLLLPAIQYARESSRKTSCANNLRQLATAILHHEQTHGFLPAGGWGPDWVGDPDAGYSEKQPGGWIFNILPFIEENELRQIGSNQPPVAKRASRTKLLESPLAVFHCPSRRQSQLYPYMGPSPLKNADPPKEVAKSDYAINGEVSPARDALSERDLPDPLGKTVLVAEKSLSHDHYEDGSADGDQLAMYAGDSTDIRRSKATPLSSDISAAGGFGSSHSSGCNFAYGDGSVRFVAYDENL